jgi:hypothetical protein
MTLLLEEFNIVFSSIHAVVVVLSSASFCVPHALFSNKKTPLQHAVDEKKHQSIIDLIRQHGGT